MGTCLGRCCPIHKWKRKSVRTDDYDRGSLIEFQSLMDVSPVYEEPISISSILSFRKKLERNLVSLKRYNEIQYDQDVPRVLVDEEFARREETLELEEEAVMEARKEAARVARLANTQQIINPARLVFHDSTTSWLGDDENAFIHCNGEDDIDVFIDESKLRTLTSRTYLPSHSSMLETGSTVSSGYGRDWVNYTNGSTPPSSIDLEWDEAGVFLPTEQNGDKNSTSASNDLEWDNDFENQHGAELDLETEQLISEIEKLTSNALEETNHGYR